MHLACLVLFIIYIISINCTHCLSSPRSWLWKQDWALPPPPDSSMLVSKCRLMPFIWEWVAPPSQLGQGGQSTQEQKHCVLENSKKAKHFQQMLRLFVLRHKSPCCGKGSWKFSYGNLIQGQKAQTGPQLSFPSWFLPGMSISFDVFIFICSYLFIYSEVSPGGTFCSAWYSSWDRTGLSSFPHLSGFITMFLWGVWRPPVLMILPLFFSLNFPSLIFSTGYFECPIWWYFSIICYHLFFHFLFGICS